MRCERDAYLPHTTADVEKQQKQFQLLQKENTELAALSDQLPAELEQLQAELESEKEAYENARSAVEQAEYARERKKKHLREGHELYESRLALKIQTSKKDGMALSLVKDGANEMRLSRALCHSSRFCRGVQGAS